MKKFAAFTFLFLAVCLVPDSAHARSKNFAGEGEVVTVDPLYSRVTIEHGAIKDFSGGTTTEFFVTDARILNGIQSRDLVVFNMVDDKGDVRITKIVKTGIGEPVPDATLGAAVQGALESTGGAVKSVTQPVPLLGDMTAGVSDATTGATGTVLTEADADITTKF